MPRPHSNLEPRKDPFEIKVRSHLRIKPVSGGVRIYEDGATTDYIEIKHDGTDFKLTLNAGAVKLLPKSGGVIVFEDNGTADYITIKDTGSAASIETSANALSIKVGANTVDIQPKSGGVIIYEDGAVVDKITIQHDGTDAKISWNAGAGKFYPTSGGVVIFEDGGTADKITIQDTGTAAAITASANPLTVESKGKLTLKPDSTSKEVVVGAGVDGDLFGFNDTENMVQEIKIKKTIDMGTAADAFTVYTVPTGKTLLPLCVQVRCDTDITATDNKYMGVGVDGANRRRDFGISAAAASSKFAKNVKITFFNSPENTSQVVVAAEVISLISCTDTTDATAKDAATMGGTGEQCTVIITGWLVKALEDAA